MTNAKARSTMAVARLAGALAICGGGIVLVGWAFDMAALKSVLPGWTATKPNAALAFILTGIALLFSSHPLSAPGLQPSALVYRISLLCGRLAGLIGLLTLSEYVFGWNPGFDQWLFHEPAGTVGTSHPGRMAPDTAICFALLAAGLETARHLHKRTGMFVATAIFGLVVTIVALFEILSYFTPTLRIHGWWGVTMMALPAATLFAVLGAATTWTAWQDASGLRLSRFVSYLWWMAGCVAALAITFVLHAQAEKQSARANEMRHRSFLLANELRQSSDDLTRMVRTYVVTGDPAYRQHYQDILDIRNGKKPRPEAYESIYWDLVLPDNPTPRPDSQQAIPLLELMRQAGFTEEEFGKLAEAAANSDGLTIAEFEAMKLVESIGPSAEADRAKARMMLYDEKYHQAKAAIMKPIGEFYVLLDKRTLADVQTIENIAAIFRYALAAFGLALVFMIWRTYMALHNILGGSVDEVHAHIAEIGSGALADTIHIEAGLESSVLGRLSETRARLNDASRERKRLEQELRASEKNYRTLYADSRDAIMVLAPADGLTAGNPAAIKLFACRDEHDFMTRTPETLSPKYQPDGVPSSEKVQKMIALAMEEGSHFFEWTHKRADGTEFPATVLLSRFEIGGKALLQATVRDISEQKRTMAALAESESRFRAIFDRARDGILVADVATRKFHYGNQAIHRMLGYTPEELRGLGVTEIHPEGDVPQAIEAFDKQALATAIPVQRKDGGVFFADIASSPITLAGRACIIGIFRDITERKQAEAALQTSERFAQATVDALSAHIAVLDDAGTIVHVNRAWRAFAEANPPLSSNVNEGANYLSVCDAARGPDSEEAAVIAVRIRTVIAGSQETYEIEYPCHSPDTKRWFVCRVSRFPGPDATRIVVAHENITARKQAEEGLRTKEHLLSESQRLGHIGSWFMGATGSILWSEELYRVYGVSPDTFTPTAESLLGLILPDDRPAMQAWMAACAAGEKPTELEFRVNRPDGTVRFIRGHGEAVFGAGNRLIHMAGTGQDITERKQAEAALRESQKQAESANRAKGVLLANMSHELRTPLNAILGFSRLMQDDVSVSAEHRKTLDIINRSGEHLLNLINNVLDMAKIDAGRVVVENAFFDLDEMVRDLTDLMRGRAAQKGLDLRLDQSSEVPNSVRADMAKLRQVLLNLLGNAIKFTPQGHVILRLSAQSGDTPQRLRLIIEVEDTGIGISDQDLARVFEPFTQVANPTFQKGTGLGLAITHQLVELMGGRISVESTLGKGSTFRVEFPVDRSGTSEVASTRLDGERVVGLAPGQSEYRILIVEDQLESRQLLQRLLEGVGLQVRVAENGAAGIELFQTWRPHFIWMDIRMPVMDGLEATRRIRALEGGRDVKIVALTASVFKEERERILAAGMDDFVPKPIQFGQIYGCLAKHLGVRFVVDAPTSPTAAASSVELSREELEALSSSVRTELTDAVASLNTVRIAKSIRRVAEVNPALGTKLEHHAGQFRYTTILRALRESGVGKGGSAQ